MNRQDRQDERSDICVKAGLNDSNQCYQMNCIVCVVAQWKFTLNQLTDRIKLLLAVPTDESEQFGKKYSMHKLVMELHKSCISRTNG